MSQTNQNKKRERKLKARHIQNQKARQTKRNRRGKKTEGKNSFPALSKSALMMALHQMAAKNQVEMAEELPEEPNELTIPDLEIPEEPTQ